MQTTLEIRNEAYDRIASGLPIKRRMVYMAMTQIGACTAKDVADHVNLEINTVVGRINELRDLNCLIKQIGWKVDEVTGCKNATYSVVPKSQVPLLMEARIGQLIETRNNLHDGFHQVLNRACKELLGEEIRKVDRKINRIKEIGI